MFIVKVLMFEIKIHTIRVNMDFDILNLLDRYIMLYFLRIFYIS